MFAFNGVYQIDKDERRIRIVDTDTFANMLAYIPLNGDRALPELCLLTEMENMLEKGELIEVLDPFYEVNIPDKYTEEEIKRCEERYQLITRYWPEQKNLLLNKRGRGEFLKDVAEEENVTISTLKRLFCQFWQRGMRKSAMFTAYTCSGGKGKKRTPQKKNGPKRADGYEGLLIDNKIEKIFDKAIGWYKNEQRKPSLKKVYFRMLNTFFSRAVNVNGKVDKVLYDDDHYPTFRQFEYYVKSRLDKTEVKTARMTETEYNLKCRPLSDTATNQVYGPGDCFMIDSTPADISLVRKSNPNKVISRLTVYIIIDVFSRLITGYYIGIENPSWDAVSLALKNMVEDKKKLCKSHDIKIEADEWPCHHLPRAILADRGDMISKRAEGIINDLGVIILNTAPYRGDMKGIVERFFRTMNDQLKQTLPGGIQKDHLKRGDKDPHIEAALTSEELEKIIIQTIILHNASPVKDYPATPEQIADGVASTPIALWEYGISNRSGNLRSIDPEKMALNVWPHDKASLSRQGLRYKDLYYGDILLAKRASGLDKAIKIQIIYNPFTVNYVYVLDGTYRKVYLQARSSSFKNMSFEEYKDYRQAEKANNAALKRDFNQRKATYEGMLHEISINAKKRRDAAPKTTKAYRKKGIREERKKEKAEERRERTKEPTMEAPAKVIHISKQQDKDYMERMKNETASIMDDLFGDND